MAVYTKNIYILKIKHDGTLMDHSVMQSTTKCKKSAARDTNFSPSKPKIHENTNYSPHLLPEGNVLFVNLSKPSGKAVNFFPKSINNSIIPGSRRNIII
jgi:hypothetical protein